MKRLIKNLYTLKGGRAGERIEELRIALGLGAVGDQSTEFVEELRFFPYSTYKDQVDAASGAFSHLTQKRYANCLL